MSIEELEQQFKLKDSERRETETKIHELISTFKTDLYREDTRFLDLINKEFNLLDTLKEILISLLEKLYQNENKVFNFDEIKNVYDKSGYYALNRFIGQKRDVEIPGYITQYLYELSIILYVKSNYHELLTKKYY